MIYKPQTYYFASCLIALVGCSDEINSSQDMGMSQPDMISQDMAIEQKDMTFPDMPNTLDMSDMSQAIVLCQADEFVQNNTCITCSVGTTNEAGDDPNGPDTMCDATLCEQDEFVHDNMCMTCPEGSTNEAGDDASSVDSSCDDSCTPLFGVSCVQLQTDYLKEPSPGSNSQFGRSIALSEDIMVVGTLYGDESSTTKSGNAYVFERSPDTQRWEQRAILTASNPDSQDEFGYKVAVSGNTIAVAAPGEDGPSSDEPMVNLAYESGAVYIFTREPGTHTWNEQAYLKASNVDANDRFGSSIALQDNTLVIGVPSEDGGDALNPADDSMENSGAVYVFEREPSAQSWTQQAHLKASNADEGDRFGHAVAISSGTIAIGAIHEDGRDVNNLSDNTASRSGAVYVFERDTSAQSWIQRAYLKASNVDVDDQFGDSVALLNNTLAIGANYESSSGADPENNSRYESGAVYVFERESSAQSWTQQAYLKASNIDSDDLFGSSIAMVGDTFAVGALGEESSSQDQPLDNSIFNAGAVYIFER